MAGFHKSVLLNEAMDSLNIAKSGCYIDATLDGGGHAAEIVKRGDGMVTVLGIERDEEMAMVAKARKIKNLVIVSGNYADMKIIAKKHGLSKVHGVLFDLGMSSWHLDKSGRGFSFLKNEKLDMRYSGRDDLTAAKVLSSYSRDDLERVFRNYGEERYYRSIAKRIVMARKSKPIRTTAELVDIIGQAVPHSYRVGRRHFATRVFQALRIEVNKELECLVAGLKAAFELLVTGGRVVAISFHSLEHRLIKQFCQAKVAAGEAVLVTKKIIRPSREEIKMNYHARSAQLRVLEKI